MSKLIRVALYALSTKQGREILVSIIAALICAIVLPIILLGGFASTYFSVFDGEANDMYVQAVNEVKSNYEIDNNLEPALLRAIYFNKYETTDARKSDIIDTIENHFIKSEELPRTVTEEDIAALQEQVDETNHQLQTADNQLETVKQKINSLNKDINTVKNKVNTYKDLLNLLENQALRNEFIIDFYSKRLADATAELNALRNEQQSLTNDFNNLSEKSNELLSQFNELSDKLQEAQDTYDREPIIVYHFLNLDH